MNLRQSTKYTPWRDTTYLGEFREIKLLLPPGTLKVVVDVGANDGFYGSNSYYEVLLSLDFSVWRPRVIIIENFEPEELNKAAHLAKNGYRRADTVYANTIWAEILNSQN